MLLKTRMSFSAMPRPVLLLEETVITYHQWKEAVVRTGGCQEVYKGAQGDPEMREMAALEVEELEQTIERLENRLKILLLPKESQRRKEHHA